MAKLIFDCSEVSAAPYAATPTLLFRLTITDGLGGHLGAIALRCQIWIEPHRRRYSGDEARRLHDLFGDTERWAETVKPIQLAAVSSMVPAFTGHTEVSLEVPCTFDLEVASGRYLQGLDDGTVPLLLMFSGTAFTTAGGGLRVEPIPWNSEAIYRMPVSVWQDVVNQHFPGGGWLRCSRETIDALSVFKAARALPTWDATLTALLANAQSRETPGGAMGGAL